MNQVSGVEFQGALAFSQNWQGVDPPYFCYCVYLGKKWKHDY